MVENDNADQTPLEDESITEIEQTPDIAEIEGYTPEQLVMQLEENTAMLEQPLSGAFRHHRCSTQRVYNRRGQRCCVFGMV